MIIGFHLTWTTYGHWFPNDPRGSWSDEVWRPELLDLRELDNERKVTQPRPVTQEHLQEFLNAARQTLKWEIVWLKDGEVNKVGEAFTEAVDSLKLEVHACAIMSSHVHLVASRNAAPYERIVNRLKGRSSQFVRQSRGIVVASERARRVPIWTQRYWVRYISFCEQMSHAIEYVRANKDQNWDFVQEYVP